MNEQIILVGVDHRRAPVSVREELSFSSSEALRLLPQLMTLTGVREAVLLATCNRTEFYLAYEGQSPLLGLISQLRALRPHARALHESCLRFIEYGDRAVAHLFRVSSGIESQILGDTQIVSQVKEARRIATEAGTLGTLTDRMISETLRAAKRARSETAIGKGTASIGAAVLHSTRKIFSHLDRVRALVLGAGDAGRDIAYHLSKVGLASLGFAARKPEQAVCMAREFQGCAVAWNEVVEVLPSLDVVVAACAARLPVLESESIRRCLEGRKFPMLLVDAGVPRNIDPEVGKLFQQIRLMNLDELSCEKEGALAARLGEVPKVEAVLGEELERWRRWWTRRCSGKVCQHTALPESDGCWAAPSGYHTLEGLHEQEDSCPRRW